MNESLKFVSGAWFHASNPSSGFNAILDGPISFAEPINTFDTACQWATVDAGHPVWP